MAVKRGRKRSHDAVANERASEYDDSAPLGALNDYEKSREDRIKANFEQFQKLGLVGLSQELSSASVSLKRASRNLHQRKSPKPSPRLFMSADQPVRRSSRLQNTPSVVYEEKVLAKVSAAEEVGSKRRRVYEGTRPEIYTKEHEKLLGNTEKSWELFVDGYAADGKRIYDPVKGKTCHQCRQKTLGHRTSCSRCQMVQGQFCGDCLYMRYGEHVLEAKENPDWICPACRGICNCSLCRQGKGWAPTYNMYREAVSKGYKSVAHYLILTRQESSILDGSSNPPHTAKRSLAFEDGDVVILESNGKEIKVETQKNVEQGVDEEIKVTTEKTVEEVADEEILPDELTEVADEEILPDEFTEEKTPKRRSQL